MNILSTVNSSDWIEILTPIFVAVSIVYQRVQSKQVKTALTDATVKSDDKLNAIHGLVDGNMTEQKRVTMMQAQRIADLTDAPSDRALAEDSKRSYEDHMNTQGANLASVIPLEHRIVMTDGPTVTVLIQRLESIEGHLKALRCNGGVCPLTDVIKPSIIPAAPTA
jgi:hypothetical protein